MSVSLRQYPVARITCLLALVLGLAACSSSLTLDNFNKLKAGQTFDEVKQIIGEPSNCDEALAVRVCHWGDDKRGISVNFVGGQAFLLSASNLK